MTSSESIDTENLVKLALASRGQGDFVDEAAGFNDDGAWEFDGDDEAFDSAADSRAQAKALLGGG